MKKIILLFTILGFNIVNVIGQDIDQSEIDTTCYVLSELMSKAKEEGDYESVLIYSNTIDKIKEKYTIHKTYSDYFDAIKISNPNLNGIVISLNSPPKSPGFANNEIDDFILLKQDGISLTDFNEFLILKKLGQGKIELENINEMEIKNLEKFKKEIEAIEIEY